MLEYTICVRDFRVCIFSSLHKHSACGGSQSRHVRMWIKSYVKEIEQPDQRVRILTLQSCIEALGCLDSVHYVWREEYMYLVKASVLFFK